MKVGDLVRTQESWSYKIWTGIIVEVRPNDFGSGGWVKVGWTEVNPIDGQVWWCPCTRLELINESR